jgi:hypothetical protein
MAWRGNCAFRSKYLILYLLSNQKAANVGDLGALGSPEFNWSFTWRLPLFVWENELLRELYTDLEGFRGTVEEIFCCWRLEESGVFTVKSMYN